MRYKDVKKLANDKFRRLTGISWPTFNLMVDELRVQIPVNSGKGHPHKLPLEDHLLLCMEYWREYRTLGMSYAISETRALRIIRKIEDILIKSGKFNLLKQMPDREEIDWEVVVVYATEIFIQRPKKTEEMV